MLIATMQLSELGVRPVLAETRQRHRYVHIGVCLFCTAIVALLCSYQALQLACGVMCAPQAPSAQPSYRDSPFSAELRRSVRLYLLIQGLTGRNVPPLFTGTRSGQRSLYITELSCSTVIPSFYSSYAYSVLSGFAAGRSPGQDASRNNATIRTGCAAAARRDSPTTPICTH